MPYKCPANSCDGNTKVIQSFFTKDGAHRLHVCKKCGFEFSTEEQSRDSLPKQYKPTIKEKDIQELETGQYALEISQGRTHHKEYRCISGRAYYWNGRDWDRV